LRIVFRWKVSQHLVGEGGGAALAASAAIVIDADVARQAQGPTGERHVTAVGAEVLVEAQEDLLRQVLGIRDGAREVEGQIEDPFAIEREQLLPRLRPTPGGAGGEEEVRGGDRRAHELCHLPRRKWRGKGSPGGEEGGRGGVPALDA